METSQKMLFLKNFLWFSFNKYSIELVILSRIESLKSYGIFGRMSIHLEQFVQLTTRLDQICY